MPIWAKVFFSPFGINIGSYPNPFLPLAGKLIYPSTFPWNSNDLPSGNAIEIAQINLAFEFNFFFLFNKLKTFFIAISKFFVGPAHLAEYIPGFLLKASTSSPESSETQTKPVLLAAYKDFILTSLNISSYI